MGALAPAARRAPARSEERRWRRLVDRVGREDGKLFAHHRSLVEVAPVGEHRPAPRMLCGRRAAVKRRARPGGRRGLEPLVDLHHRPGDVEIRRCVPGRAGLVAGLEEHVVGLDRKNGHLYRVAWPCATREALGSLRTNLAAGRTAACWSRSSWVGCLNFQRRACPVIRSLSAVIPAAAKTRQS
jgi:hypothetical protein